LRWWWKEVGALADADARLPVDELQAGMQSLRDASAGTSDEGDLRSLKAQSHSAQGKPCFRKDGRARPLSSYRQAVLALLWCLQWLTRACQLIQSTYCCCLGMQAQNAAVQSLQELLLLLLLLLLCCHDSCGGRRAA